MGAKDRRRVPGSPPPHPGIWLPWEPEVRQSPPCWALHITPNTVSHLREKFPWLFSLTTLNLTWCGSGRPRSPAEKPPNLRPGQFGFNFSLVSARNFLDLRCTLCSLTPFPLSFALSLVPGLCFLRFPLSLSLPLFSLPHCIFLFVCVRVWPTFNLF